MERKVRNDDRSKRERERESGDMVGRRIRNYTKTMCLLSISGRTRWGFYESLGRTPNRRSVVVYSRKESGPVAQMTLTTLSSSPLPLYHQPTCTEIYGNSLFASFKSFRIILLPLFLLPLASKPTLPPAYKFFSFSSSLLSSCLHPTVSSSSSIRTSIFVQVSTSGYRCNADTNAMEHLSP